VVKLKGEVTRLQGELEEAGRKMKDLSASSRASLEELAAKLKGDSDREKETLVQEIKVSLAAQESKLNAEWNQRCEDLEGRIERLKGEVEAKGRAVAEAIAQRDLHWKEEVGLRAAKLLECERRAENDRWVDSHERERV
jgi:hypothetical protein